MVYNLIKSNSQYLENSPIQKLCLITLKDIIFSLIKILIKALSLLISILLVISYFEVEEYGAKNKILFFESDFLYFFVNLIEALVFLKISSIVFSSLIKFS